MFANPTAPEPRGYHPSLRDRFRVRTRRRLLLRLRSVLAPDGMRLLDLGGGTGATTAEFGRGARELVVLDPEDRKTSLGRASGAPVTFVSGVAEALPFGDGRFERVTSVLSCHHFSRPDDAFREAARVLLPGGRFVVYDLDPSHWSGRAVALVIGGHHHSIDRFASPEELVRRARSVGFRTARGERFGTGAFLIAER